MGRCTPEIGHEFDREGHCDKPWDFSSAGLHEDKAECRDDHWIKNLPVNLARLWYQSIHGTSVIRELSSCLEDAAAHTDSADSRSRSKSRVSGDGQP